VRSLRYLTTALYQNCKIFKTAMQMDVTATKECPEVRESRDQGRSLSQLMVYTNGSLMAVNGH